MPRPDTLVAAFEGMVAEAEYEVQAINRRYEIAAAYDRSAAENAQIVEAYLKSLSSGDRPQGTLDPTAIASLAALSQQDRQLHEEQLARFRMAIESDKALKKAVGLRNFNNQLKGVIEMMAKASAAEATDTSVPLLTHNDSRANANAFLDWCGRVGGFPRFAYWGGQWYEYGDSTNHYAPVTDIVMRARVSEFLSEALMATSDQPQKAPNDEQTIKEILMSSTYLTHVDGPDPNCRISADRKTPPVPLDVIVFRNVMIDISKFAAGGVDFYTDKGPEKFVINVIDVDFDPAAQCPKFLAFLDQICNGDQEMMFALQLLLGLLLTRDTSLQSIFLFVGTPGSGKGTLLRIFTAVLGGTVNVVTALLSSLSGDFGASRFLGKTVGIFSDSHSGGKDPMKAIELLLTVSGEDDTSVDKKFEDARNGRLPIRFIVTMNELVSLQDRAGALHRRFIAFKFTRSFTKIAKGGLSDDIIKTELSGICNWALDGLKKLSAIRQEARACGESDVMAARHALQPSSGRVILEKMQELGTPIRLFVDEMCLVDQAKTVDANEIHYEYQSWCARAGLKPVSRTRFVQDITDAYPAVTEFRPGSDTGLRPRFLKGITLLRHVQPANSGPLSG